MANFGVTNATLLYQLFALIPNLGLVFENTTKFEQIKQVPGATPEGRFAPKILILRKPNSLHKPNGLRPDHDDDH